MGTFSVKHQNALHKRGSKCAEATLETQFRAQVWLQSVLGTDATTARMPQLAETH